MIDATETPLRNKETAEFIGGDKRNWLFRSFYRKPHLFAEHERI